MTFFKKSLKILSLPLAFGMSITFLGAAAKAEEIDLSAVSLPWKNAPTPGALYDLGQNKNAVYVFEVFSLGCHWCNVNAPKVQEMSKKYDSNKRIQFIDLGLDVREIDYTRWISTHKPAYPVLQDMNRSIYNALSQTNGIPQTFVVDCKGTLVGSTVGSWGDSEQVSIEMSIAKAQEQTCN